MQDIHIIWNPTAGSGAAGHAFKQVSGKLEEQGLPYTAEATQYPGHARELAAAAAKAGRGTVITIGGDGTFDEVADSLTGTDTIMGLISAGTGNDLIRALHLSREPLEALDTVLHGSCRKMDMLEINGRKCINVAGFGFDVEVLINTEHYKSSTTNGSIAYLRGLLAAIHDLKLRDTVIRTPEKTFSGRVMLLAAGNGQCIGGGMPVTPQADPFDGLLDLCVISDVKKSQLPILLPRFLKGKHLSFPQVTYLKTTEVTAECTPSSRVQLDGEIIEETPFHARILPGALRVMVNA